MADEKLNILTLAMAKKYTDNSIAGAGAVAGVPCQIQSITPITGGNRVTFLWEDNNNVSHTSTLDVMDGADGEENKIDSISVNGSPISVDENKNVDITVPSIEGLTKDADLATVAKSGSYDDLSNKPTIQSLDGYAKISDIPTQVSELENDSNYLSSIPEEYVTETELSSKGYLTEHQDISGKVDKVEGKSLISDTEIARLASVDNYDDTAIKAEIAKKADATTVPSKVSELTNDSNYQTAEQVNSTVTTEIAKVVADAPEDLNTLKEMSDWIAGHENDASAMNSAISDNKTAITALQTGKADKSDIPTTVAELTDSSDYAKKTDIPTTLPANGGNADTVNNHTVKSDVPENAKFTDTIYDDTEVKGSIEELSSNLDTLEYGDIAGGKNLIDVSKVIRGEIGNGNIADGNNYITDFIHLEYGKNYILSNCIKGAHETAWFTQNKEFIQRTFGNTVTPPTNDCYYARIEYDSSGDKNAQLEEGTIATPYKPYIPSVKILAKVVNDNLNKKANASLISMVDLGFTKGAEVPLEDFMLAISKKMPNHFSTTYKVVWGDAKAATVVFGNKKVSINGGTLYCSQNSIVTNAWVDLSVLYVPSNTISSNIYKFTARNSDSALSVYMCEYPNMVDTTSSTTSTWSSSKINSSLNDYEYTQKGAGEVGAANCNDFYEYGNYTTYRAYAPVNCPTGMEWGFFETIPFSDEGYAKQICKALATNRVYIRTLWDGTWGSWTELATMDNVANSIIRESKSVLYNLNNVDNIELTIDIAKSGYKPIAVSLYNSGTHLWFAQGMYFDDTVCKLSLRGVTLSSATNAKCEVLVTYIKTS